MICSCLVCLSMSKAMAGLEFAMCTLSSVALASSLSEQVSQVTTASMDLFTPKQLKTFPWLE